MHSTIVLLASLTREMKIINTSL